MVIPLAYRRKLLYDKVRRFFHAVGYLMNVDTASERNRWSVNKMLNLGVRAKSFVLPL